MPKKSDMTAYYEKQFIKGTRKVLRRLERAEKLLAIVESRSLNERNYQQIEAMIHGFIEMYEFRLAVDAESLHGKPKRSIADKSPSKAKH